MDTALSYNVRALQARVVDVTQQRIAPLAEGVDRDAAWPVAGIAALREEGLLGLHVPASLGGMGLGLEALAAVTEAVAAGCASTAMVFGMHCVATAVIAAKATADQEKRFLRPIAEGRHVTSLAFSEAGSGALFYIPGTVMTRDGDHLVLRGTKQFVTSGSIADSYVLSTVAEKPHTDTGDFNCIVVENATPGVEWLEPWNGFGMRGNGSRGMRLVDAPVPHLNLLGEEGDELWYVFEVVAPYFLVAMSSAYLGVAQAALNLAIQHLKERQHTPTGQSLAQLASTQETVAGLWARITSARLLLYRAAQMGDAGDPHAIPFLLSSKAELAEVAVRVTNDAMTLCGGVAYRENGTLARLLRDARASEVMAPTTAMLRQWTGRALLGQALL